MWVDRKCSSAASYSASQSHVTTKLDSVHINNYQRFLSFTSSRVKRITLLLLRRIHRALRIHSCTIFGIFFLAAVVYASQRIVRGLSEERCVVKSAHVLGVVPTRRSRVVWPWNLFCSTPTAAGTCDGGGGFSCWLECYVPFLARLRKKQCADDFDFADHTEAAFNAFRRRVKQRHEAPLLRTLDELERLGEVWRGLGMGNDNNISNSNGAADGDSDNTGQQQEGGGYESVEKMDGNALRELIYRKANVADELLTQLLVQLDMAPVGDNPILRNERKESIVATAVLAERIRPWLYI